MDWGHLAARFYRLSKPVVEAGVLPLHATCCRIHKHAVNFLLADPRGYGLGASCRQILQAFQACCGSKMLPLHATCPQILQAFQACCGSKMLPLHATCCRIHKHAVNFLLAEIRGYGLGALPPDSIRYQIL